MEDVELSEAGRQRIFSRNMFQDVKLTNSNLNLKSRAASNPSANSAQMLTNIIKFLEENGASSASKINWIMSQLAEVKFLQGFVPLIAPFTPRLEIVRKHRKM